ncbi:MAG: SDR family oxidoreductase [Rhodospirillaceae bacterium]|nr:SDR family oxidoreductase [Rhodospirillaceae bacterium]
MADEGKVAIITGAGSGIGRASALALARAGYRVVLVGRRAEPLQEAAAEAKGAKTLVVTGDVSKSADVAKVFAETVAAFGRVDVVFNNAGIFPPKSLFEDITEETWTSVVGINLTGAFFVAQQAFRVMKAQSPQGGRIINNGSISAQAPRPNSAPYTATKHAMTGLTKSLSLDGRKYNIACGQIDIGNAATPLMAAIQTTGALQANGQTMVEPAMDVNDVADAVVYMAGLPLSANVQYMTVMATAMPLVGRG